MISFSDARHLAKQQARKASQQAQMMLNAVLWQIIMEHAMDSAEDEGEGVNEDMDKVKDGVLVIPLEEMKEVPKGFTLNVCNDNENIMITASVKEEKNIILLGEG